VFTGKETVNFCTVDIDIDIDDFWTDSPSYAGLYIDNKDGGEQYLFTKWSRAQLLTRLGTTDKWFRNVALQTQIDELNTRLHCLHDMKIRSIRSADEELLPYRSIRGMVSKLYTDIPDLHIIEALSNTADNPFVIKGLSGITDRAFYAYVVVAEELSIPNTHFKGWPGVVVRNSEVGYTSLSLTPFLYTPYTNSAAVLTSKILLRKIHRGKINELEKLFEGALNEAAVLWTDLSKKLQRLENIHYANEDETVERMVALLVASGSTKRFANTCGHTYKQSGHNRHTALGIFEAILTTVESIDEDSAFDQGAIAGAVLIRLVF
jgi:hypothetical protein